MAEELDNASPEFWLPDEFLDDDFFSEEEKAAVVAAKSDSEEDEGLGGLSRRMAGLDCDGNDTTIPKVGFLLRVSLLFWNLCFCACVWT